MTKEEEFNILILGMDIPIARKNDWQWLLRNLPIRNSNHVNFEKAYNIVIKKCGNKNEVKYFK